ncbi:MAG: ankyrin repeat domain-containing protein [Candidatus Cloacimonetes bacterium]|nr:ankyrin repeat domain-containing protein [Candidatus Cloacimonadota bacterium]
MKIFLIILSTLLIISSQAISATIFEAIQNNNIDEVTTFVTDNPDILNERDEQYCDPLTVAAIAGNLDIMKYLISQGADINTIDREGSNLLHNAAANGHLEVVQYLLDQGFDINAEDANGNTALLFASSHNNFDLIKFLLDKGADLEAESINGTNVILNSAFAGNIEIVDFFIDKGFSVNHPNQWGVTPLMYASIVGNKDVVEFLLENGADVTAISNNGETALVWATIRMHFDIAELLMDKGLSYNDRNEHGATMFFSAGKSPMEAVTYMIENGADTNVEDSSGTTPLHIAAQRGNTEVATYLIEHGADVNKINEHGWTPLKFSLWSEDTSMMELLLEKGATIEIIDAECETGCQTYESSPLHLASRRGAADFMGILIDHGADVNIKNEEFKQTPLHLAAAMGYGDIVALLIESGCDESIKDINGKTAADLALEHGNLGIAKMLLGNETIEDAKPEELLQASLQESEIYIWFVTHSGWFARTKDHLLVFDYWRQNRPPDNPSIANGMFTFNEIKNLDVIVLVSHVHQDHYSPEIFTWNDSIPNITYVMGFDPHVANEEYIVMQPRTSVNVNGVDITAIYSNDTGVGFMVEADGVTILHPGDHANRERDFSGDYLDEIYYLQSLNKPIDIAFMPISGCNFGDNEAVRLGVHKTFEILEPTVFFPMHAGDYSPDYMEFVEQAYEDGATPLMYYQIFPGDRFYFNTSYLQ